MPAKGKLDRYDSMRDFASTPEPSGGPHSGRVGGGWLHGSPDGRRRFVVQRHRARRLHYDLRLEVDGVLVSWAVPKGPSLDPARKSLAVKVEDHPYAYGWFEGVIPSGYGKGDVVLWDDGWWEPDPEYPDSADPAAAIEGGELKFVLAGHKLRGRYVILQTSGRGRRPDGDEWLLFHKRDGCGRRRLGSRGPSRVGAQCPHERRRRGGSAGSLAGGDHLGAGRARRHRRQGTDGAWPASRRSSPTSTR